MFSGLDGRRHEVIIIAHFPLLTYLEIKNDCQPLPFLKKARSVIKLIEPSSWKHKTVEYVSLYKYK